MKLNKIRTVIFGRIAYYENIVPKSIDITYYYPMEITCTNCGKTDRIIVKKGKYAKDAFAYLRCSNCRCIIKDCKCNTCS